MAERDIAMSTYADGDVDRTRADSEVIMQVVSAADQQKDLAEKKIERVIHDKLMRDKSPEAKAGRRRMLLRACYGEFMCSLLFYTPIFCCVANGTISGWQSSTISLAAAFVSGFQAIAVSFAFSSVSGAQFNSAISIALWMTGKLSNRRTVVYVLVQLLASILGMVVVACIFHGNLSSVYDALAVTPIDDNELGRVFATEFFLTFFLTYIAFTVAFEDAEHQKKETMSFKTISDSKGLTLYASTPQSKTGFAPFSIGFTIFSLCLIGGTSGGAFNPGRLLGPAMFSGKWDYIYLYWLGEVVGAACAGLLVNNMHRIGIVQPTSRSNESTAKEVVNKALSSSSTAAKIIEPSLDHTTNPVVKASVLV